MTIITTILIASIVVAAICIVVGLIYAIVKASNSNCKENEAKNIRRGNNWLSIATVALGVAAISGCLLTMDPVIIKALKVLFHGGAS